MKKGIPQDFAVAKSCFDLSSDHSPVLITLEAHTLNQEIQPSLKNKHTNWDDFRQLINERLTLNVFLKTEEDIEAAVKAYDCPILIKQKIEEKRRLRTSESKRLLNTATQELKQLNNNKNDCIQTSFRK
jgi:hypothetical protein